VYLLIGFPNRRTVRVGSVGERTEYAQSSGWDCGKIVIFTIPLMGLPRQFEFGLMWYGWKEQK
jgi:hypothetical protein